MHDRDAAWLPVLAAGSKLNAAGLQDRRAGRGPQGSSSARSEALPRARGGAGEKRRADSVVARFSGFCLAAARARM